MDRYGSLININPSGRSMRFMKMSAKKDRETLAWIFADECQTQQPYFEILNVLLCRD